MESYKQTLREKWVLEWPGQAVLAVTSCYWTSDIHAAFEKGNGALNDYLSQCNKQIDTIVGLVRGKLSRQNRVTLGKSPICSFIFFGSINK